MMATVHRQAAASIDMKLRPITKLMTDQRKRLKKIEKAIADQDLHLEIFGLHPTLDQIICQVECPYENLRCKGVRVINTFVFDRAPTLKLTAEGIAADYKLRRDVRCGQ